MKALIVIDYQNDYCEGGPHAYNNTLEKIPKINRIRSIFDIVIFTKNWFPINHCTFTTNGGKTKIHCIQNTKGSEINDNLLIGKKDYIITKNTYELYTSSSAFYDASEINVKTKLADILNLYQEVYICGMDLETTIFSTIMDCYRKGIKCNLIVDCVCHNLNEYKYKEMMEFVKMIGVKVINSNEM